MNSVTWSCRVRKETKEGLQSAGVSAGEAIEEYYRTLKSKSLKEKLKELANAKLNVAQLEHDVTQIKVDCTTSDTKCNTIFANLNKNPAFNINNLSDEDRSRIRSVLRKNDISKTVDEFVREYQNNGGAP